MQIQMVIERVLVRERLVTQDTRVRPELEVTSFHVFPTVVGGSEIPTTGGVRTRQ